MKITCGHQKISFIAFIVAFFLFPSVTFAANPTVTSFSPEDGQINVDRNTNLVITFDQTVIASGSTLSTPSRVRIFNNDGTLFEDINASGSQVTVNATIVTIDPLLVFAVDADYYIQIETDAFVNAADESFAAIADTTTWNFKIRGFTGGAAARQRRERLNASMPTYSDTESPCPIDVGIFIPNSSCGDTENISVENTLEEPKPVHTAAPTPVQRITPELEEARLKRSARLSKTIQQPNVPSSPVRQYESRLHERACERVEKRLGGDQKMIDRVNDRLKKRFGFMCEI